MPNSFTRAYRLQVGTTEIDATAGVGTTSMRIVFQVERDAKRIPNACEVQVYNLARGTRDALAKLHSVPVALEAGYVGALGTVFQGDLRSARSRREGPDIITRVSGGDGELRCRTASIHQTFPTGTPVGSVIGALGKALGVRPGNLGAFAGARLSNGSATLARPLTLHGAVYDCLEQVTRSCGLRWSVQDAALEIREVDRPVSDTTGPLLREDSGLIGEPEVEIATKTEGGQVKGQPVVSGTCLMRTDIVPGRAIRVESLAHTGNLVILSTVHRGDSAAQDWYTDWTGRPY